MNTVLAQCAGGVEGSENLVFHDSTSFIVWNLMRAKRCVLLREIHDLETREWLLSASRETYRRLAMSSGSSGGRHRFDIVVVAKKRFRR